MSLPVCLDIPTFDIATMIHSLLASLAVAPIFLSAVAGGLVQFPNRATDKDLDAVVKESPLLSLHRSLCEVESISNSEYAVGNFLAEYLESRNFTVVKQKVPFDGDDDDGDGDSKNQRFNVFAYPSNSTPAPEIILTTHMDVVPPYIPYSLSANKTIGNREDILISGRGTVDAKADIAAQIIAALNHLESNPDTALALLFVVSEETTGAGMAHFSDSKLNPDPAPYRAVIFGEPTEQKLASGHKGGVGFTLNVTGEAAHSGYPWLGESAVSAALPILSRLDALGSIPEEKGGLPASDKYGQSTLNIGKIEAGVASNVVPASATASILIRLADGTPADAEKIVRKAVSEVCIENKINETRVKLDFSQGYGPVDLSANVEGFDVGIMHYGTDIPGLKIHGDVDVKRFLYGPGSIHVAHGENEALTVGALEAGAEGYRKLIKAGLA